MILAAFVIATSMAGQEPKELRDARRKFESLRHPSEADRVRYITGLVRLRERFTRADAEIMHAIDAEVLRHPMPATADVRVLVQRLVGRWQSPRRRYFYHPDGTWASNEILPRIPAARGALKVTSFSRTIAASHATVERRSFC